MRLPKFFFACGDTPMGCRTAGLALLTAALAFSGAFAKPGDRTSPSKSKGAATASTSPSAAPTVDSVKVHQLYLEGEFDAAIAILEGNLKETRQYSRGDSAFIFKHLGVMYAANIDTREKGKHYMHRLLLVEPTARIMDMYASDMIYMIFKNIKEEYEQSKGSRAAPRQYADNDDAKPDMQPGGNKADTPPRRQASAGPSSGNGKKWLWAGVAAATVAAGVGAYVLMTEEEPQPTEKDWAF